MLIGVDELTGARDVKVAFNEHALMRSFEVDGFQDLVKRFAESENGEVWLELANLKRCQVSKVIGEQS